jgi:hypothetical protein
MKNEFRYILSLALLTLTMQVAAQAPVPVKKDPSHRIVFKNKLVTIIYPRILPGDTTPYHIHETPSVFLVMRDTYVFDQTYGKPGENFFSSKGETWYQEFYKKQTHRIANTDSVDHQSILIELSNEPKSKYPDPIPGLPKPEYFEKVRIYPLRIVPNSSFDMKTTTTPAIVVAYKGNLSIKEKGKTFLLREGDIKWVDEAASIEFLNEESEPAEGYVYEIRK